MLRGAVATHHELTLPLLPPPYPLPPPPPPSSLPSPLLSGISDEGLLTLLNTDPGDTSMAKKGQGYVVVEAMEGGLMGAIND